MVPYVQLSTSCGVGRKNYFPIYQQPIPKLVDSCTCDCNVTDKKDYSMIVGEYMMIILMIG